jgi:hypothetical protein
MNAARKRLVVILAIIVTFFSLASANTENAFSAGAGGRIDLYTQKEPYSGRGLNARSDAFGPGEEVQIYASVTYNDFPIENVPVSFAILGPPNSVKNATYLRSAVTNDTGVAKISFRISHINETTFGEWTVYGNVQIEESIFTDIVKFKAGWIVEIVYLRTISEEYVEQSAFSREDNVGIELVIHNIAMTERTATLTVAIYDQLGFFVNSAELNDLVVQPNGTLIPVYFFIYIPKTAHIGQATVHACAFTASPTNGGVPYSQEISESFLITANEYFLTVRTEPSGIAFVSGEGWYEQNANVNLTAPLSIIASPGVRYKFIYWDLDGVFQDLGADSIVIHMDYDHTATAHYILQYYLTVISPLGTPTGEGWYNADSLAYASLNFNIFNYGNDTRKVFANWSDDASGDDYEQSNPIIMSSPKTAVANWKTQYRLTTRTVPVEITTILGEGWYDQYTNLTVYASAVLQYAFEYWDLDGTRKDDDFNPITIYMDTPHVITAHYIQVITYTLTIMITDYGTTNPSPGTYKYVAGLAVQIEALPNAYYLLDHWELNGSNVESANPYTVVMNGNQTIKAVFSVSPAALFWTYWFYWLCLPLSLLAFLAIALFYRRKRRKSEESFYSGWSAWYYCYDK